MSRILINDGTVVVEKLTLAELLPARLKGLIGRGSLPVDHGMLLRPCKSIHMWFMRFPIDAAFLDKNMCVLKIVRNLRPWQVAIAPRKTHCVLETASGQLKTLKEGMQLICD
jgi:uncharacterized membrane protein (UPF0127 family)